MTCSGAASAVMHAREFVNGIAGCDRKFCEQLGGRHGTRAHSTPGKKGGPAGHTAYKALAEASKERTTSSAKSKRMVPGAESEGLVAPSSWRPTAAAFLPSHTCTDNRGTQTTDAHGWQGAHGRQRDMKVDRHAGSGCGR